MGGGGEEGEGEEEAKVRKGAWEGKEQVNGRGKKEGGSIHLFSRPTPSHNMLSCLK